MRTFVSDIINLQVFSNKCSSNEDVIYIITIPLLYIPIHVIFIHRLTVGGPQEQSIINASVTLQWVINRVLNDERRFGCDCNVKSMKWIRYITRSCYTQTCRCLLLPIVCCWERLHAGERAALQSVHCHSTAQCGAGSADQTAWCL